MGVNRRRFGRGLEGAGDAFATLGTLLLRRQEAQANREATAANARTQMLSTMMNNLASHPEQADQIARGAKATMGVDISSFLPTPEERAGKLTASIQGAKVPTDLPTDINASMRALGIDPGPRSSVASPFADMAVSPSEGENGTLSSTQYQPGMSPITASLNRQLADRSTMMTGEEERTTRLGAERAELNAHGTTTGTNTANNENFPEILRQKLLEGEQATALDISKFKQETPLYAQRAGAEAAARARATFGLDLEKYRQQEIIKNAAAGELEQAKMMNEAINTVAGVGPDWERMQKLSAIVNTGKNAQVGTYYVTSPLQLNKNASELDSIAANMSKRLANDKLFGGNRGAQSEKDSQAILNRLPNSYDSKEMADRKIKSFNDDLYKGLEAMSHVGSSGPPEARVNAFRAAIGLPPLSLAEGGVVHSPLLDSFLPQGPGLPR